ncbi:FtsX-like permease family protein [Tissierella sp.]|uniref:ABC transporter permease n=1 Tax=Tissierella sp. TaxID=41274 RepID=UPI00285F5EE0|nr:FtsX-like permease family protein [Tissierella sp.]MDR7855756.1 FtsX-like permease family protein [Tissierella sp.]
MKMKDIARRGLKGRKKDTLLLKLVITLSFIFIVTSTIFEASIGKTKLEQRLDLYGEWNAAYLGGDEETFEKLKSEPDIEKLSSSLIIGESFKSGVIGTFNQDLIDMGRLSLYKGRYPETSNEIMVELNQMTNMGLELEVGQKLGVDIYIRTIDVDPKEYILNLNQELFERSGGQASKTQYQKELDSLYEERLAIIAIEAESEEDNEEKDEQLREIQSKINKIYDEHIFTYEVGRPEHYKHHETPFEIIDDVTVVASNDYFFYYLSGDEVNPEIIREKGLLHNQNLVLKKEFIITGILDTYTDKWDLGGYKSPNTFLTEEGGRSFIDALYSTSLGDFSDYEFDYNTFIYSKSFNQELMANLEMNYPNREKSSEEIKIQNFGDFNTWMSMYGMSNEEVESYLEKQEELMEKLSVKRKPEEWRDDSLEGSQKTGGKIEVNTANLRQNRFSYPDHSVSTEYVLTLTIIAVIFIATALAIFQIFLTQMKRRSRKIVLLKSIGATNMQIIKVLAFEGLYLLKNGLLIGIPGGVGLAAAIIYSMNTFGGRDLQFHVIPTFFILGIIAGCLALFIGMAVPMFFAIRIPLVGTMSKPPKHKIIKHKENESKKIYRQTFKYINWKYFKLNKAKTFISFGISFITITILLTTVLLCYLSFDNYRTTVLVKNRPDYAMEAFFGETSRQIWSLDKEILAIEGVESIESYKVGKQTFLWYEGIEKNEMLQTFDNLLPPRLLNSHFSFYNKELEDQPEWINNALYTKIYSIDPSGSLYKRYEAMLTEGTIDKTKFTKGEEVVLLIPMYLQGDSNIEAKPFEEKKVLDATNEDNRMNWMFEQTGSYKTTYSSRYKNYYSRQKDIKPGDTIYLSADKEQVSGESLLSSYSSKEVVVGGIIYYFDKDEIWPFSNNVAPYAVIGSHNCMESIYPNSKFGMGYYSPSQMKTMIDIFYPYRYGRTLWYINTNSNVEDPVLDSKLLTFANRNSYTLYNYKESNVQLYQEAFNNALIIALLGITSAAIACIILYNTLVSKMEQDKNRIGILQALGVTRKEFSKHYISVGVLNGLLAVLIVNLGLMIVMFITSVIAIDGMTLSFADSIKDIFVYRLWQYPWMLHTIICIIFFILTVIMNYLPGRKIAKDYPVENIRSLSR